ncbi:HepT-like ribonuclease domain-containing protein [Cellulomonas endometrii]|uniref:HepT-like ribonuclease domain-containing protein n=1 Tax=Cellulomonas endometrii TaxID=3036301 RepID=UPI0024AE6C4F|nr:HepT-like ribonuclease domain-containing protein [Cellulomonas endometrii]
MTDRAQDRWLQDIREAVRAIRLIEATGAHVAGSGADAVIAADVDAVVVDALTYRVMTIGEAVKNLDVAAREARPEVPWSSIARMRDVITHHYHRRSLAVIRATVDQHLGALDEAARWLLEEWPERASADGAPEA